MPPCLGDAQRRKNTSAPPSNTVIVQLDTNSALASLPELLPEAPAAFLPSLASSGMAAGTESAARPSRMVAVKKWLSDYFAAGHHDIRTPEVCAFGAGVCCVRPLTCLSCLRAATVPSAHSSSDMPPATALLVTSRAVICAANRERKVHIFSPRDGDVQSVSCAPANAPSVLEDICETDIT